MNRLVTDMHTYPAAFRRIAVTGLLFLLPLYVVLIIATKAWVSLSSLGATLATMFGLKSIMGVGASSVLSGLSLLVLWFACGLIAHVSVVAAFRSRLDGWLAASIPGYTTYRQMVEEKLQGKVPSLPYSSALLKQQNLWRPVYVVEQDLEGHYVVFTPDVPDTTRGTIMLATRDDVLLTPSLTATDLDASLKKLGAGLLREHRIQRHLVAS